MVSGLGFGPWAPAAQVRQLKLQSTEAPSEAHGMEVRLPRKSEAL